MTDSFITVLKNTQGLELLQLFATKNGVLKTDSDFLGVVFKGVGPDFDSSFIHQNLMEGIIPAIESAHVVAYAKKLAPTMDKNQIIVITISGRGDKDCAAIARYRGEDINE